MGLCQPSVDAGRSAPLVFMRALLRVLALFIGALLRHLALVLRQRENTGQVVIVGRLLLLGKVPHNVEAL